MLGRSPDTKSVRAPRVFVRFPAEFLASNFGTRSSVADLIGRIAPGTTAFSLEAVPAIAIAEADAVAVDQLRREGASVFQNVQFSICSIVLPPIKFQPKSRALLAKHEHRSRQPPLASRCDASYPGRCSVANNQGKRVPQ